MYVSVAADTFWVSHSGPTLDSWPRLSFFVCTGRIVDVNNMWVSVLGWGRQEMVNRDSDVWGTLLYGDSCEHDGLFDEWMSTSLEEPLPPIYDEMIAKDGRVLAVRAARRVHCCGEWRCVALLS